MLCFWVNPGDSGHGIKRDHYRKDYNDKCETGGTADVYRRACGKADQGIQLDYTGIIFIPGVSKCHADLFHSDP